MNSFRSDSSYTLSLLSLDQARRQIVESLLPLPSETVSLARALNRLPVQPYQSAYPKPSFDQSTRDGYALHTVSSPLPSTESSFRVVAEVAAGFLEDVTVHAGEAVRIMTGAPVPSNCGRVVPFELCREVNDRVVIPNRVLEAPETFIRHRGKDLPAATVLIDSGKPLFPDHLLMLAENGVTSLEVYRRPQVAILCTGSELVYPGQEMQRGQKVSGNGVLLQALVEKTEGLCLHVGTVSDAKHDLVAALETIFLLKPDIILTTGGMGPGKFDLLEDVFARLGGEVLYNSLQVRPGKSTLYGRLATVPFFALPGPPPAVRLLFHELIAPGLRTLQGYRQPVTPLIKAHLCEAISAGKSDHLSLKGGVVDAVDAALFVRPAGQRDRVNGILHLPGGKKQFAVNELVDVRLLDLP